MPAEQEPDPLGHAIRDYYHYRTAEQVWVFSDIAEPESIDPAYLFRSWAEMPVVEKQALQLTKGYVLDIGAGAGVHAQWLADQGFNVTALEASPGAVEVLARSSAYRTVYSTWANFRPSAGFDTILLLMNGAGVAGNLKGLQTLLRTLAQWLNNGGQVLLDSTDLRPLLGPYLTEVRNQSLRSYYGVVEYQMAYRGFLGTPFEWLFADWPTFEAYAKNQGFQPHLYIYGTDHHWLGRLQLPHSG